MTESVRAALRLDEEILDSETGSISCEFRSRSDGNLFALRGGDGAGLELRIVGSSLVYEATVPGRWSKLEAEDVRSLDDGRWHSAVVTVSAAGTRLLPPTDTRSSAVPPRLPQGPDRSESGRRGAGGQS